MPFNVFVSSWCHILGPHFRHTQFTTTGTSFSKADFRVQSLFISKRRGVEPWNFTKMFVLYVLLDSEPPGKLTSSYVHVMTVFMSVILVFLEIIHHLGWRHFICCFESERRIIRCCDFKSCSKSTNLVRKVMKLHGFLLIREFSIVLCHLQRHGFWGLMTVCIWSL